MFMFPLKNSARKGLSWTGTGVISIYEDVHIALSSWGYYMYSRLSS